MTTFSLIFNPHWSLSLSLSLSLPLSLSLFLSLSLSLSSFRLFGQFTMETILAAAFACDVGVMKGEANTLAKAAAAIVNTGKNPLTHQEIVITLTCT